MKKYALVIGIILFCRPLFAAIILEPVSLNLYKVKSGEIIKRSFEIFNPSSESLPINRIYGDCGCISIEPYQKSLPPYGKIEVGVVFDSNRENFGNFKKIVYISLPSEEKKFEIYGQVVSGSSVEKTHPQILEIPNTHQKTVPDYHSVVKRQDSYPPVYIAYFYSSKCGECAKVKSLLEGVKKSSPHLAVREFDTSERENRVLLEAMISSYKIGDNISISPPVLFLAGLSGDRYLSSADITAENIIAAVNFEGSALKDIIPPWDKAAKLHDYAKSKIRNRFENFKILPVLIAALIDGVNPCAFGVLLFFVSYAALSLKRSNREVLLTGLNFTFGVFSAYFLMGIGLLKFVNVIGQYSFIAKIFYLIVGILAIFLSVLSFIDFYSALRIGNKKPSKLLLKLPFGFFNKIFQIVEKFANFRHFIIFSFVVGFLVSIIEFFCTGQIYFPTIIYILSIPELRLRAVIMLLLYCFVFVLPLLVVFVLIFTGVRSEKIENFNKRHLGTVKLLNGIIFLCLGVFILLTLK